MHGVKRQKKTAASLEARELRKKKEQARIHDYLEVQDEFFRLKEQCIKTEEALSHTTNLLTLNPELYTVWNYRREILLSLFDAPLTETQQEKPDVFASLREPAQAPAGQDAAAIALSSSSATSSQAASEDRRRQQRTRLLLERDLELTEHALRAHPKVYWIWNHRTWCLHNLPEDEQLLARGLDKWKIEMKLVDKMLELDPRNFHGWSYRRYLAAQLALTFGPAANDASSATEWFPASLSSTALTAEAKKGQLELAQSELQYALGKIESNISNFSAWHQRTKLLPRVWDAKGWDEEKRRKARDEEYELVKQAMYTDPADQSVWIYHRWLIEQDPTETILNREIETIEELLELEPDSKWCMHTLAHYKTLLFEAMERQTSTATCETSGVGEEDEEKKRRLRAEVRETLEKLMEVDRDRVNRYRDLLEGKAHF
ncbi:Rab geranylgeranyltransferase [Thecaphora frezii]